VAAFIAFSEGWEDQDRRKERLRMAILLGALAGTAYAAGCLLAPLSLAPHGARNGPITVAILSWSLFLGVATASANLLRPGRRPLAYGLLVLVLAGFPLRIAYQQMLAVLGAVLVFAPEPVIAEQEAAPSAIDPHEWRPTT
jgi:hypothetical protein